MQQANTCIVLIQGNEKLSPRHWNTWLVVSSAAGYVLPHGEKLSLLALAGQPSSDGITIKNTFGVDVYYINQSHTLSFPIELVETKSDVIVSWVETGLGRWALVVAVISVDAYTFTGFLRPDLPFWGYRNRCFLVALCHLIVRRLNLEVTTKHLLYQQIKIPRVSVLRCT